MANRYRTILGILILFMCLQTYGSTTNPGASGTSQSPNVAGRVIDSASVDTGVNNVPTEYNTSAGSKILDEAEGGHGFCLVNYTESKLAGAFTNVASVTPSVIQFYIPAAPTSSFTSYCNDEAYQMKALFVKSATGSAISGGKIDAWSY